MKTNPANEFFKSCSSFILCCQIVSLLLVALETGANQAIPDWQKDLSPLMLSIVIKSLPGTEASGLCATLIAGKDDLALKPSQQFPVYVLRLVEEGFVMHADMPAGHQIFGQRALLTITPDPRSIVASDTNVPMSLQSTSLVITRFFNGTFKVTDIENARLAIKNPTSFELIIGNGPDQPAARGHKPTHSTIKLRWVSWLGTFTEWLLPSTPLSNSQLLWEFEIPPNNSAYTPFNLEKPSQTRSPSKARQQTHKLEDP